MLKRYLTKKRFSNFMVLSTLVMDFVAYELFNANGLHLVASILYWLGIGTGIAFIVLLVVTRNEK